MSASPLRSVHTVSAAFPHDHPLHSCQRCAAPDKPQPPRIVRDPVHCPECGNSGRCHPGCSQPERVTAQALPWKEAS